MIKNNVQRKESNKVLPLSELNIEDPIEPEVDTEYVLSPQTQH